MMYLHEDKEIIDFTHLDMVILSTEEEVEVEEDENSFKRDKWIGHMEDLEEESPRVMG